MPSYQPNVVLDGARATITVRSVHGTPFDVEVDLWTARKLTLELAEKLMEAGR